MLPIRKDEVMITFALIGAFLEVAGAINQNKRAVMAGVAICAAVIINGLIGLGAML